MSADRPPLILALALALALLLPACEKIDRNMWESPAFGPQSPPVRTPPEGSVPTKGLVREPDMAEASAMKSPVAGSEAEVAKGKELYGIFCVPCHGESGRGDGLVGKKYRPAPENIGPGGVAGGMPDGTIYAVITRGTDAMPAFGVDIPPKDRWLVVTYVRRLGK
ncbi:MAG TPA: cytochrome c [Candidatus Deferrimicrobiaceae bacterium]